MKKYILFTLVLLSTTYNLFSQALLDIDSTHTERYSSGKVKKVENLKKVKNKYLLHGEQIEYYSNGNIKEIGTWFFNTPVDTFRIYWRNGKMRALYIFKNARDYRRIKTITYYRSGACRIGISEYIQYGNNPWVRDGVVLGYYKNGITMDSVVLKNGNEISRTMRNEKGEITFQKLE